MQKNLNGIYLNEYLRISKQLERIKYEYDSFLDKYNRKNKILKNSQISKKDLLEKYNIKSIRNSIIKVENKKFELSSIKVLYLTKIKEYLLALKLIECIYRYDNSTINPLLFDVDASKSINLDDNNIKYLKALSNIKDVNIKNSGIKMCKEYIVRNEIIKDISSDLCILNGNVNALLKTSSIEDVMNVKDSIVKLNNYLEIMLEDVKDKTEDVKVLKYNK